MYGDKLIFDPSLPTSGEVRSNTQSLNLSCLSKYSIHVLIDFIAGCYQHNTQTMCRTYYRSMCEELDELTKRYTLCGDDSTEVINTALMIRDDLFTFNSEREIGIPIGCILITSSSFVPVINYDNIHHIHSFKPDGIPIVLVRKKMGGDLATRYDKDSIEGNSNRTMTKSTIVMGDSTYKVTLIDKGCGRAYVLTDDDDISYYKGACCVSILPLIKDDTFVSKFLLDVKSSCERMLYIGDYIAVIWTSAKYSVNTSLRYSRFGTRTYAFIFYNLVIVKTVPSVNFIDYIPVDEHQSMILDYDTLKRLGDREKVSVSRTLVHHGKVMYVVDDETKPTQLPSLTLEQRVSTLETRLDRLYSTVH